jgi:hypothetical protein
MRYKLLLSTLAAMVVFACSSTQEIPPLPEGSIAINIP